MSWMGVPQFIRIDVPYLVDSGALGKKVAELGLKTNDSAVHEQVTTAFAMLDIETEVAGIPLRGNVGVQAVKTKQNSEGWEYRGNNDNVDFNLLFKRTAQSEPGGRTEERPDRALWSGHNHRSA
jgi:hypothetical protein